MLLYDKKPFASNRGKIKGQSLCRSKNITKIESSLHLPVIKVSSKCVDNFPHSFAITQYRQGKAVNRAPRHKASHWRLWGSQVDQHSDSGVVYWAGKASLAPPGRMELGL